MGSCLALVRLVEGPTSWPAVCVRPHGTTGGCYVVRSSGARKPERSVDDGLGDLRHRAWQVRAVVERLAALGAAVVVREWPVLDIGDGG